MQKNKKTNLNDAIIFGKDWGKGWCKEKKPDKIDRKEPAKGLGTGPKKEQAHKKADDIIRNLPLKDERELRDKAKGENSSASSSNNNININVIVATGPAGAAGATGATGATGPTGATGAAGGAAIVPFSSGSAVLMSTSALGEPLDVGLVGFGSSFESIPVVGGEIDISGLNLLSQGANFAFSVPRTGTITSIAAFFSTSAEASLPLANVTITAQLYRSAVPNNIFTAIPGAFVTLAPSISGSVPAGTMLDGFAEGLDIAVNPRNRLLMVFSITNTGIERLATVTGYASAGISIS